MTANEHLAAIKANLSEIYDTWELSQSEIAELSDTTAALVAALDAVLELHRRGHPIAGPEDMCLHCRDEFGAMVEWPCPTVEAITEALEADQ